MGWSSFGAIYSAFSHMHLQKTWESMLNAPIELDDTVFAEMLRAGIKALIAATAIAAVLVHRAGADADDLTFGRVLCARTAAAMVADTGCGAADGSGGGVGKAAHDRAMATVWLQPLAVLLAYAAFGYWVALALTRRRFHR